MATITEQPTPLESVVIGDNRVASAFWEENYGPPQHRIHYLNERFKEAGYDIPETVNRDRPS